ncbi:hypothetical protein CAPTEDRAFT_188114 [Capitella teleta]|uniref:Uncharacterized protein n=1 Tax=Capitella teleta TaxID=283909 RepID=R7V6N5_CAPTE|nr:hypothetical protein CAPTEDRAFT_188114 [Capitella teleta]|eukprot:ELU12031.1 hypothetical protein CAPTEDRAFT_188114 [Capitella teleta]
MQKWLRVSIGKIVLFLLKFLVHIFCYLCKKSSSEITCVSVKIAKPPNDCEMCAYKVRCVEDCAPIPYRTFCPYGKRTIKICDQDGGCDYEGECNSVSTGSHS